MGAPISISWTTPQNKVNCLSCGVLFPFSHYVCPLLQKAVKAVIQHIAEGHRDYTVCLAVAKK